MPQLNLEEFLTVNELIKGNRYKIYIFKDSEQYPEVVLEAIFDGKVPSSYAVDFSEVIEIYNNTALSYEGPSLRVGIQDIHTENWYFELESFADEKSHKADGLCPQCKSEGYFVKTALVCANHGVYGGF